MINFILSHKVVVGIIALLVAVLVWIGLSSSSSSSSTLLDTQTEVDTPDQDLVATLIALRAVKLDGSLFSDPGFQSLRDFSTPIVPEPVGRPDPFAPLGNSVVINASTTRDAQIFTPRGKK